MCEIPKGTNERYFRIFVFLPGERWRERYRRFTFSLDSLSYKTIFILSPSKKKKNGSLNCVVSDHRRHAYIQVTKIYGERES